MWTYLVLMQLFLVTWHLQKNSLRVRNTWELNLVGGGFTEVCNDEKNI